MRVETQVTKMTHFSSNTVTIGNGSGINGADKRGSMNHESSERRRQTRFVNKKGI